MFDKKSKLYNELPVGSDADDLTKNINEPDKKFVRETFRKINELSPTGAEILNEEEIKYLAMLKQKDEITFTHSLEVLNAGKEKLRIFGHDLEKEGVSDKNFLKACILHDIGKINLPDCILKAAISHSNFENIFFKFKKQNPDFIDNRLREMKLLKETQGINDFSNDEIKKMVLDYRDLVSLEFLFAQEPEKLQEINDYGINPLTNSLFDVIRGHEEQSRKIIQNMETVADKKIVAEIAGSHHGYKITHDGPFPVSKQVLRLTVLANELLHLADVYAALRQKRLYKERLSEMESLFILAEETQKGLFNKQIAKRWIKDSIENLEKKNYDFSNEDKKKYKTIKEFVETKEEK